MAFSFIQYIASGSTDTYNVTFGYLDPEHVTVKVDGVSVDFTFPTPSQVQITSGNPAAESIIEVRRVTPADAQQVVWRNAANLTETDMNTADLQFLYITQEAFDVADSTIQLQPDNTFDAGNTRLTNLADPVEPQDAVTRSYTDSVLVSANASALAAASSATDADVSAQASATSAAQALSAQSSAQSSATESADSAVSASNSATSAASSASSAALHADSLQGTSSTSVLIGTGTKTLTTQENKFFDVGNYVLITSLSGLSNYMTGKVTSYSGTELTVDVEKIGGSGTYTDWVIAVSGAPAIDGVDGVDGQDGVDGINGTNGIDGVDGQDGADGQNGVDGLNGQDGQDGLNGSDGEDGAMVLISEISFSDVNFVDIALPGGYDSYVLKGLGITVSTADRVLLIRTSSDGGLTFSNASNGYRRSARGGFQGGVQGFGGLNTSMYAGAARGISNQPGNSCSFSHNIFNTSAGLKTQLVGLSVNQDNDSQNLLVYYTMGGCVENTLVTNAIRVLPSNDQISGTLKLYGVS